MSVEAFIEARQIALAKLLDPPAWDEDLLSALRSGAHELYRRREKSYVAAQEMYGKLDELMVSQGVKLALITEEDIEASLTI